MKRVIFIEDEEELKSRNEDVLEACKYAKILLDAVPKSVVVIIDRSTYRKATPAYQPQVEKINVTAEFSKRVLQLRPLVGRDEFGEIHERMVKRAQDAARAFLSEMYNDVYNSNDIVFNAAINVLRLRPDFPEQEQLKKTIEVFSKK